MGKWRKTMLLQRAWVARSPFTCWCVTKTVETLGVTRAPSVAVEDERRPHRERDRLHAESSGYVNRIKSFLTAVSVPRFAQLVPAWRQPDGRPHLREVLVRGRSASS